MGSIVQQHNHVLFLESMAVHQVLLDVESIVVAATQLALLPNVVDTHQDGALGSTAIGIHHVKGGAQVDLATGTELGVLGEASALQIFAHLPEDLYEG